MSTAGSDAGAGGGASVVFVVEASASLQADYVGLLARYVYGVLRHVRQAHDARKCRFAVVL